jgi:hypothetical protein
VLWKPSNFYLAGQPWRQVSSCFACSNALGLLWVGNIRRPSSSAVSPFRASSPFPEEDTKGKVQMWYSKSETTLCLRKWALFLRQKGKEIAQGAQHVFVNLMADVFFEAKLGKWKAHRITSTQCWGSLPFYTTSKTILLLMVLVSSNLCSFQPNRCF